MKNILHKLLLTLFCLSLVSTNTILAQEELSLNVSSVYLTVGDQEKKNVLYEIVELDADVMMDLHFDVSVSEKGNFTYQLVQYDDSTKKRYDVLTSPSESFTMNTAMLQGGIPLYLGVFDASGKDVLYRLLTIRLKKGKLSQSFPEQITSQYESAIQVKMDELLPGMNFNLPPYFLPISAKAYTDGRFVLGIGINSTNTSFWADAAKGKIGTGATHSDLEKAFYGDSEKRSAVTGSNMGLIFDAAGWVQGNSYTNDPLKGELNVFVGSGFMIQGQYAILTWDVTATGGANGVLQFELKFNEEKSKYDFLVDRFGIGVKMGLELYGGLGLSSLISFGIYGAGSIAGYTIFYPNSELDSLVLAGECGFKLKLFSRTLFSFALVSGSHDFVRDTKKGIVNLHQTDSLYQTLMDSNYASIKGSVEEPDDIGTWYTSESTPELLSGYENDPDFEHMIAQGIYPDNFLQVVDASAANLYQDNIVFLGSDPARANGNRSRLMNFYFDESKNFISDPVWVISEDDGTADFEPYAYRSKDGNAYVIWRNAMTKLSEDSSISDIAASTDIFIAKHQVASSWMSQTRVSEYAFNEEGLFAAGAKIFDSQNEEPMIAYYLAQTSDPLSLNEDDSHDIYVARSQDGEWVHEKIFTFNGPISSFDAASLPTSTAFVITTSKKGEDESRTSIVQMYQDGNKVFERSGAYNGRLLDYGNRDKILTWMEDGSLYGIDDFSTMNVYRITPEDIHIPSSDYKIYGSFGSSYVVIMGTASKESSEDLYAIFSLDGGLTWARSELTDIDENALVNESALAFTRKDEPILFYSVQNYDANYDPSVLDASNYLEDGILYSGFEGLQSFALGQDDPRFSDTHTDLYVKARKANHHIEILSGSFDDEDSAKKGNEIPFTLQIRNDGLYPIEEVTLYNGGEYLTTLPVSMRPGTQAQIHAAVLLPADSSNKEQTFEIGISGFNEGIDSSLPITLGVGHVSVLYNHELVYMNEDLHWQVTSEGFANKAVHIYVYDENTNELVYEEHMDVPAGHTKSGSFIELKGLWRQNGHNDLSAYLLLDGESVEDIDSTRKVSFSSIEEIYVQDFSHLYNSNFPSPSPSPAPKTEEPIYDHEPIQGEYKLPLTYVSDSHGTQKEETKPQKEETPEQKEEEKEPEVQTPEEVITPENEEPAKGHGFPFIFYILIPVLALLGLLLFILFGILRKDREEE